MVENADLAHLVERHLAKVEVASSSLVIRSIFLSFLHLNLVFKNIDEESKFARTFTESFGLVKQSKGTQTEHGL